MLQIRSIFSFILGFSIGFASHYYLTNYSVVKILNEKLDANHKKEMKSINDIDIDLNNDEIVQIDDSVATKTIKSVSNMSDVQKEISTEEDQISTSVIDNEHTHQDTRGNKSLEQEDSFMDASDISKNNNYQKQKEPTDELIKTDINDGSEFKDEKGIYADEEIQKNENNQDSQNLKKTEKTDQTQRSEDLEKESNTDQNVDLQKQTNDSKSNNSISIKDDSMDKKETHQRLDSEEIDNKKNPSSENKSAVQADMKEKISV